jgi:hypothetical protein
MGCSPIKLLFSLTRNRPQSPTFDSNVKSNMRQIYIVIIYLFSCSLTRGQEKSSDKLKNLFENNFIATGDFQFLKYQNASLGLGFAHVPEH